MSDDATTESVDAPSVDMFESGVDAGEFALPSDERHVAIKEAKLSGEPLPAPAPAEPEAEPEPEPEPYDEPAAAAAEPADAFDLSSVYAKFGINPETATEKELTLARSYREVELLQARQATELGEWRAFAAIDDVSDDEGVEPAADDPAQAMTYALEHFGAEGLQDAYAVWEANDPGAAATWLGNARAIATEEHYAAKFAEQEQRLQQQTQIQNAFVEVGRATALEAQKVREDSFVASSTYASSGKPSKADEIAAEWDEMERPWKDGWQL
jgi:hypothetical protein